MPIVEKSWYIPPPFILFLSVYFLPLPSELSLKPSVIFVLFMYNKHIKKVAVLGSGLMGTGIAAHLAGCGIEVLMLDILPADLSDKDAQKTAARNRIGNTSLQNALKAKPAPFYDNRFASRITVGNFEDDFAKIKDCDWIIEVVVERLDIKKQVYEKVEQFRAKGSLVTSNTSGIPIHLMTEGRSDDFRKNFCGTHFFNPVRYMHLLEIIPTADTDPAVVEFFMHYGDVVLGKQTVLCKDTPAFIANRVGVYAMAKIFQLTHQMGLGIDTVDALTGPAIGRPKTGTFRLADLVGMELAARAGYDPRSGITLWNKMAAASKGAPPEWLSTHPSGGSRINDIEAALPLVMPVLLTALFSVGVGVGSVSCEKLHVGPAPSTP